MLELISSRRCPFVQRSIIALEHKSVPYKVTYLDPYDPPAWFTEISPMGKVPLLRLEDGTVLFESAIINEYIDETTPGQLHPDDPLTRAFNRGWIEFGGQCLSKTFGILTAGSKEDFDTNASALSDNLDKVQDAMSDGPFFNGKDFSLVDAAYAPLLVRLSVIGELTGIDFLEGKSGLKNWLAALSDVEAVQKLDKAVLKELFVDLMKQKNSWLYGKVSAANT